MFNWDASRIASIINGQAAEGQSLEFKSELPSHSDRGKAEFLKDVSALANAAGGAILYGVAENAGVADSLSGIQISDADAEVRRLSQVLESGIEPRVAGIQFTPLALGESSVLVVDVPQSLDAPHRYLFNGHSKFVQRTGTHTSELSYGQLRSAFSRTSARIEELRHQWNEQLKLNGLWRPIVDGPVCIVRLASVMAADGRQVIDPKLAREHWEKLMFPSWGGGSPAFNYEGLAAYPPTGGDSQIALMQVNRSGSISAYRTARLLINDQPLIPSVAVVDFMIQAAQKLVEFALAVGLRGSAVLQVALVRLTGFQFAIKDRYGFEEHADAGVDEIRMPEFWLESLEEVELVDRILRPGLDLVWQAYGRPECPLFNEDGLWSPR